mgnify:CR=1 FL=1
MKFMSKRLKRTMLHWLRASFPHILDIGIPEAMHPACSRSLGISQWQDHRRAWYVLVEAYCEPLLSVMTFSYSVSVT